MKVPAKEILAHYEKETKANAVELADEIYNLIEAEIPKGTEKNDIHISDVKISNGGTVYTDGLTAQNYTYTFEININSDDLIVDFVRSNAQISGVTTIDPTRVEGIANRQLVGVGNSIVIKPTLEASVFTVAKLYPIKCPGSGRNSIEECYPGRSVQKEPDADQ